MYPCVWQIIIYLQYAQNLGHILGLCIILIETINLLQEGDGYVPVTKSRITYTHPDMRGSNNNRDVLSEPHHRGYYSGNIRYLENLYSIRILYISLMSAKIGRADIRLGPV